MVSNRTTWGLGSSLYLRVARSDSPPNFISNSRRPEFGTWTQAIVVGRRMKWHAHNMVKNVEALFWGECFIVSILKTMDCNYGHNQPIQ